MGKDRDRDILIHRDASAGDAPDLPDIPMDLDEIL
jgi:hypothetical protein